MATKPKPTKLEIENRVTTVHDLLLAGSSRAQVIQYASEKTDWSVSDRQIDTYIKRANQRFEQAAAVHQEREYGLALQRLTSLYQRNLKIQDFRVALSILKERHALLGLYPPAQLHVKLSTAENTLLVELLEALGENGLQPSTVFEAMIQEVHTLEVGDHDE